MPKAHAALAFSALLAASSAPAAEYEMPVLTHPAADARVREYLVDAATRAGLDARLEIEALRCYDVGPAGELCEWRLGRRDSGWRALARVFETRDQVSVLCVLPSDGRPRDAGSCSAHHRRSTRDRWKVQRRPGSKYKKKAIRGTREFLECVFLTQLAIFGQVSAGLTHDPQRTAWRWFACDGL